ncbi:TIR domain-containing protein [Hymenobacter sp. 5317J-9]|uniref:toll/interleukin-1 receptor domain-containing protein n=1 Tax=Hymenobacter sp. 5317J-9 TaxID=2932250 RepID=UPI001FD71986|nr:TIR domain-containing protein [Hymenobacter sp. 5317J-9]UOQ96317.1 TIR domain-containing protein [Hymenobacter sp. 5317J-9]
MDFKYDVTLSFAGEDREYVERVAHFLSDNGIKVFYDKFEEADLWGKDLGVHFDYVYRKSARYCIPFISQHYKKKIWTNHEIKTAIARAIENHEEYILPARFDDTEIDGIRPTIGYINLKSYSPEEFASLVIKKLGKEPNIPLPEKEQENDGKIYLAVRVLISEYQGVFGAALGVSMINIEKEHRYFNEPYFTLTHPFEGATDTFYLFDKLVPVTFPAKLEFGQVASVDYNLKPKSIEMWASLPEDTLVQAVVTTTVGERYKSNQVPVNDVLKAFKYNQP